ncbi:hypothetical protein [Desulfonatronum thioautotrophicum]|uniref:hypothetical protein n=1 Tax=Desulfonatronum thioautotrophicum TaxID=617001 RepID=UPI0005EBB49E|nr:hypothetical protein [Desulfonatronum thioautotrophicum]
MTTDSDKPDKDVLQDVLLDVEQVDDPELLELMAFIDEMRDSFQPPRKEGTKRKQGKRRETKKRSSSYLTPQNFESLDRVKRECQRLLKVKKSGQVSKSRITDISLEIILKDFQQHREKSILARKLKEYLDGQG